MNIKHILISIIFTSVYIFGIGNAFAATVIVPDSSGDTTIIPTTGTVIDTDITNLPEQSSAQASEQAFPIANTSLASTRPASNTIEGIIAFLGTLLSRLGPFIIALTVLTFIWGILQLVRGGSEDARKQGRQIITFGIVALFVMVSIWGLVNILVESFTLNNTVPQGPGVPRFK